MLIKALIAVLVLPGIVTLIIPAVLLYFTGNTQLIQPFGLIFVTFGFGGLLWCVVNFFVQGRGTLAPWSPPERLVVEGLYHCTRNPMYISVGLILLGWAVSFNSLVVYFYLVFVVAAFHIYITQCEEPWLAQKFGSEWERYADRTPRWLW
jgi:protein-S-isoprenylcysteine O-methyltransferase Ste14